MGRVVVIEKGLDVARKKRRLSPSQEAKEGARDRLRRRATSVETVNSHGSS